VIVKHKTRNVIFLLLPLRGGITLCDNERMAVSVFPDTAAPVTLRSLRLAEGLDHGDLAARVSLATGRRVTWRASVMWEFRGVKDIDTVLALAGIYQRPVDMIRTASANSRALGGPPIPRGPKKKSRNVISPLDRSITTCDN
jgi:hypothetical protein